jgi:2-methylcitrate dehydratase PrpD
VKTSSGPAFSADLADWASSIAFDDLPQDIVEATRLRVMDVIGLALAGAETDFGRSTRDAAIAMSPPGPCRVWGTGDRLGATMAAFANGACAQALEYDDTHNESIVHMSSPAVAAALALSEIATPVDPVSGRDLITAIAVGNEISCRVGSVAAGQFHRLGFHPTGLFAPFGVCYLAGRLLGLEAPAMARAAGICGSFAAGLLECWVDGTQTKFLHPGWAAHSGMAAAFLARTGTTGPAQVFEGRFGLFASHLQDPATPRDFTRIAEGLGTRWDSRNASFKPFPAAHVLHPYIDALWRLRTRHGFAASDVEQIDCPVAGFIVPIVCEPTAEKLAPATDSHGRVSLQYTLAEALHRGELGRQAYSADSLTNPKILALARRVRYEVDPRFPGPGRFKGAVRVTLKDGRSFAEVEEFNRGSAENPMTDAELRAKFEENASGFLSEAERASVVEAIGQLEDAPDASVLVGLTVGGG